MQTPCPAPSQIDSRYECPEWLAPFIQTREDNVGEDMETELHAIKDMSLRDEEDDVRGRHSIGGKHSIGGP